MNAISAEKIPTSTQQATGSRKTKKMIVTLSLLAVAIFAAFLGLGLWPLPDDNVGDDTTIEMMNGSSGLKRLFPAMLGSPDNLPTHEKNAERADLGRLLFFDPLLSGNNDTSCATCHHPDLGLSDGLALSLGQGGHGIGPSRSGGVALRRSSPSLWNVAYSHSQFWDGRSSHLEEQANTPIINKLEMDEDPERLLSEIKQIGEYVEKFDRAFEGSGAPTLSLENVGKALAAFERTLTANNSPFDQYVKGERDALSDSQRRGFNVFRSGVTRCIECHGLPTFADRDFKVLGVLDSGDEPDWGRFEITKRQRDKFAFKVPTLRNVALSPPYMHNGSLKNLDEVIDFYSSGGRPKIGTPVDDRLRAFRLTEREREDLIAFLFSLVDESNLPEIPDRVPSGLPVISRLDNPARKLITNYKKLPTKEKGSLRPPQLKRVEAGQSIQKSIDSAQPGDIIEVMPGIYHEQLVVDVENLTLRGITSLPGGSNEESLSELSGTTMRPILDGQMTMSDGLLVSGSNFRFEGFEIRNYIANAVLGQYANNLALTNLRAEKIGLYGIYIFNCSDATIENVTVSKTADIGIYVNSSRNTKISSCESYGSTVGIYVENCLTTAIDSSFVHDNTGGILVSALPGNIFTIGKDCRITNNRILNNNSKNMTEIGTFIGELANGTGIIILAADNTEVTGNEIRGNASCAVGVLGLYSFADSGIKFDLGSVAENNWIHDNTYSDNGSNPDNTMLQAGLGGGDLVWDLSGWSNRWSEASASKATPVLNAKWPTIARRAYWRILNFIRKK